MASKRIKTHLQKHPYYTTVQFISLVVLVSALWILRTLIENKTYNPDSSFTVIVLSILPFYAASVKVVRAVPTTDPEGNLTITREREIGGLIMVAVGVIVALLWMLYLAGLTDPDQIAWRESLSGITLEIIIASLGGLGINFASTS